MSVSYFKTPRLDSGRLAFALGLVAKDLPQQAPDHLRAKLGEAQAAANTWFETREHQLKQQRKGNQRRGDTQAIDRQADALLGQVHQICAALASLGDAHPQGKAAGAFVARFFPDGVGAVTKLNFEAQLQAMESMRDAFNAPPAQAWIAALPIDSPLAELLALLPSYRAELEASNERVTADEVRAAKRAAQDLLEQVIAGVRYTFAAEFDAVLAPLSAQVRRYRKALAQNRNAPDVDPQSGEPLPETD